MRAVVKSLRDHAFVLTVILLIGLVLTGIALDAGSALVTSLTVAYWLLVGGYQVRFMRMTHRERQLLDAASAARVSR